jgi:hypothetical protein
MPLRIPLVSLVIGSLVAPGSALVAQSRAPRPVTVSAAQPVAAAAGQSVAVAAENVDAPTIHACYLPLLGVFYLIDLPGLAESCRSIGFIQHKPIFWDRVGPTGDKGATGAAGSAGAAGPEGEAGDKGPTGGAGPQGEPGPQGETGDKGAPGADGAPGDKGPVGDEGPPGESGIIGDKGPDGDKGPAGAAGPAGDKGPTGDRGASGEQGAIGEQGPAGDTGLPGDQGEAGDKGPIGDQGPLGPKGSTGDKGQDGAPGPDGIGLPCNDGCVTTPIIADLAVTNEKLAPISEPGKIANSATTATSLNTANRIVARDGAGGFSASHATVSSLSLVGVFAELWHTNSNSPLMYSTSGSAPQNASIHFGVNAGTSAAFAPPQHVALGTGANRATTGQGSTAVGFEALNGGSSFGTVAVGASAMDNGFFPGHRHVVIGARSGRSISGSGTALPGGNIAIGADAGTNLFTHSNALVIGRGTALASAIGIGTDGTHTRTFIAGIDGSEVSGSAVLVSSTGQLGVAVSSARFKENIADIGAAGSVLAALRPVSYRYLRDLDRDATLHYGLIAEDVAGVAPELVVRDSAGGVFTVRYDQLVPMLVSDVQQRRAQLALLQAQSEAMRRRIERLELGAFDVPARRPEP